MTLTGSVSNYTGGTTIRNGTVAAAATGALGSNTAAVLLSSTLGNNAALVTAGANVNISNPITASSYGTNLSIGGATDNNTTFSGPIAVQGNLAVTQVATQTTTDPNTFLTSSNALSITGGISAVTAGSTLTANNAGAVTISNANGPALSDGSGQLTLVMAGTGTLTLASSSNFTGGTSATNGLVVIADPQALGVADPVLGTGAALYVGAGGTVQQAASLGGTAVELSSLYIETGIDQNGGTTPFPMLSSAHNAAAAALNNLASNRAGLAASATSQHYASSDAPVVGLGQANGPVVPEPGTLALLAAGAAVGLAAWLRRKLRKS
jgi:autotransporter-associated beta strand protein